MQRQIRSLFVYQRERVHRSWRYCNTRSMRGVDGASPLFHLRVPKINLIYGPRVGDVSDIKLIRTDTTLDLSQKAEKRYQQWALGPVRLSPSSNLRSWVRTGPLPHTHMQTQSHTAACKREVMDDVASTVHQRSKAKACTQHTAASASPLVFFSCTLDQGRARTQSPTTRNFAVEIPTFGEFTGVSMSGVQWTSLALGEPP